MNASKFRTLQCMCSPTARKLWTPPALRTRAASKFCLYTEHEKEPQITLPYEVREHQQENDTIFYPDFSSVSQLFGKGTDMNECKFDSDQHDEKLNAAALVWKSSVCHGRPELNGEFSIPSSLFHGAGQDTENVMLMSLEYAESLQRDACISYTARNEQHSASRNVFRPTAHGPRQGGSIRSFSTTRRWQASVSTPYQLLGVSPSASTAEIKSQFYTIAKKLHPDKLDPNMNKKEQEEHLEKFRLVVKAYELLKDKRQREMYDKYRMGWEGMTDVPPRMRWSSPSQFRPATQAEWEQWYMWSEMLRRGRSGHSHTWQRMAQNEYTSDQFYGYAKVTPEDAKRQREAAPLNHRIFFVLFFLGSIIATIQIDGAKKYSTRDSSAAAQHTSMVARNLEQARMHARSEEGLMRQRVMLERARENKRAKEQAQVPLLTS